MTYAEIYNNAIVQIHNSIPSAWNNISNFNVIPEENLHDLSSYGYSGYKFYPVIEEDYPSNIKFYNVSDPTYSIDETNKVVNMSWPTTQKTPEEAWQIVRSDRNRLLFKSDWTQIGDSPLNEEQKNAYRIYRQALRDITIQNNPFDIIWPNIPT